MKRDQLEVDRFGLVEFSLSQLIWGLKFEDRSLMLEVWSSKSKAVWGSQPEHTPWEPTGQMLPIKRFIWTSRNSHLKLKLSCKQIRKSLN